MQTGDIFIKVVVFSEQGEFKCAMMMKVNNPLFLKSSRLQFLKGSNFDSIVKSDLFN